jgi:hypothetical protein
MYWNYVDRHGNPDKEGEYDVILIYDESRYIGDNIWEPTGKKFAVRETRYFGDASKFEGWVMKDQPEEGLAWSEECGSYMNERVYAWYPPREFPDVELPDDVEWAE